MSAPSAASAPATPPQGPHRGVLSVIVPAYNEDRTIDLILERILAVPLVGQVVVVDDGSSDETAVCLAKWKDRPEVVVCQHPQNRGKGAAIRTGLSRADRDYVIIQDADLEYDPQDYPALLAPLLAGTVDVVYGSRYHAVQTQGFRGRLIATGGIAVINSLVRWLYGVRLTDEATCYKVFRRRDLDRMELVCDGFEFCPEVTAKAARMGLSIVEVPIHYSPRTVAEGKKIRLRDGWTAIKALWRWRRWRPERQ
ncbi:glycosyltransferase family 2 protein [Planctellipticum variicoloris]|uniref:glycosyltransferase family 2 protein n=1 Tax=Planctellipticum variicoloris TaxID=3064265 RepID=UPI00301372C8|nr:glycosyltransferase family 2 protein [Planctomycetaceae bacterium SH412]